MAAATTNPIRYPPVGPWTIARPSLPWAKTGDAERADREIQQQGRAATAEAERPAHEQDAERLARERHG